jgi:hypothetical protein
MGRSIPRIQADLFLLCLAAAAASCSAAKHEEPPVDAAGDEAIEPAEVVDDGDGADPSDSADPDRETEVEEEEVVEPATCGTLEPESIRAETGFASIVSRNFGFHGDKTESPLRSPLRLFEDGVELGPAHAAHDTIRAAGGGAFNHWGNALYFSASDNTDPAANGRVYTFSGPCWEPLAIEPVFVAESTTNYSTFQSHNQKVLENAHGIFITYITSFSPASWHLMRSTDGGVTFQPVCEATYTTKAPAIETDEYGNIYMIHSENDESFGSPAYFYRFDAAAGFPISASSQIPNGSAGKFTTFFDRGRDQIYLFTFWDSPTQNFFALDRSGNVLYSHALTQPGSYARIQYPHLRMDGFDLYAAWTTQDLGSGTPNYRSIHFMRSGDGGHFWQTAGGANLVIPVVADDTGPTSMVSLADEVSVNTWLSNFIVDGSGIHFMYYAASPLDREHYVRFSKSTGSCDINLYPAWEAGDSSIASLDGFFVARPDGILFAAAHDRSSRLAVFLSDDGGVTWLDYALSEPLEENYAHYSIGGCREVTPSGRIMGTFTKQNMVGGLHEVFFFSVDAGLWSPP